MTNYVPAVRGWLEESTGQAISVSDPTPEELIATAQAYDADMDVLRLFIYRRPLPPDGLSPRTLAEYLEVKGYRAYPLLNLPNYCGDCGALLEGGATRHAKDCFVRRLIIREFPGAVIN